MRIAFSCPAAPSHLYATTTLARKVQERGHDTFFLGVADAEPLVRRSGVESVS